MRIFLSYASQDRVAAERIFLAINSRRRRVFFDRDSIEGAADYHSRLRIAVKESDLLVFLISPDSLAPGRYTLTELELARKKWPVPKGRVLPVMLRGVDHAVLPPYLASVSIVETKGNVAAEVAAQVESLENQIKPRRPPDSSMRSRSVAPYLDYLDRESTAVGQLSLFALALSLLFAAGRIRLTPAPSDHGGVDAVAFVGSSCAVAAAWLFYLQRSHLLWLRGQISLAMAGRGVNSFNLDDWLTFSEGWGTWVRYRAGWVALVMAVVYWLAYFAAPELAHGRVVFWLPLAAAALYAAVQWQVFTRYSDEKKPYMAWFHDSALYRKASAYLGAVNKRQT